MPARLPSEPLFMERQTYRQRRLMDAARLLPVAGAVAVFLPILWVGPVPEGGGDPAGTAKGGLYLFGVWMALILAAAVMSRRLLRNAPPPPADGAELP